jgi:transketolase
LSKGHGPAAYYAVLAAKGFIDATLLPGFGGFGSPLGYHPDRMLLPGVEISSGSLGHGHARADPAAWSGPRPWSRSGGNWCR